jgi:hypothetical protein
LNDLRTMAKLLVGSAAQQAERALGSHRVRLLRNSNADISSLPFLGFQIVRVSDGRIEPI